LGVGVWGIGPNPQPPIPNPQSPIPNPQKINFLCNDKYLNLNYSINKIKLIKFINYHKNNDRK